MIPLGCVDCAYEVACHIKHKLRLCYHGDLHSDNVVGSGARNIEILNKFKKPFTVEGSLE